MKILKKDNEIFEFVNWELLLEKIFFTLIYYTKICNNYY